MSTDSGKGPIPITNQVAIPEQELSFSFARSGGPGGQNVNKVNTKAVLRFDVVGSQSLGEEDKRLILERLASRLTKEGELVLASDATRSQEDNKRLTVLKLQQLLRAALRIQRPRKATRPSRAAKERRLATKKARGARKQERSGQGFDS
ncbi:alternative ribosome rescue aminoacyl-tRNA hydrolase ArfB [Desulfocurvibacter africanus]|uniref:Class I peptide chain release factor n=1 Tax=Desulfocurvibacter africanus subsp. africanus str. Walvis Bay TaxID=690850 RepID=F3Z050_DESAF|nr:alternative ribosome rescue aminoacyl-tRNA hydrolase ArfB [Desulfocurvibacter africanus]EGJ52079.1 Class I peptide chain release factor [Desulfocurvibacter africanus subsp. africanus str. Walvis Bay]